MNSLALRQHPTSLCLPKQIFAGGFQRALSPRVRPEEVHLAPVPAREACPHPSQPGVGLGAAVGVHLRNPTSERRREGANGPCGSTPARWAATPARHQPRRAAGGREQEPPPPRRTGGRARTPAVDGSRGPEDGVGSAGWPSPFPSSSPPPPRGAGALAGRWRAAGAGAAGRLAGRPCGGEGAPMASPRGACCGKRCPGSAAAAAAAAAASPAPAAGMLLPPCRPERAAWPALGGSGGRGARLDRRARCGVSALAPAAKSKRDLSPPTSCPSRATLPLDSRLHHVSPLPYPRLVLARQARGEARAGPGCGLPLLSLPIGPAICPSGRAQPAISTATFASAPLRATPRLSLEGTAQQAPLSWHNMALVGAGFTTDPVISDCDTRVAKAVTAHCSSLSGGLGGRLRVGHSRNNLVEVKLGKVVPWSKRPLPCAKRNRSSLFADELEGTKTVVRDCYSQNQADWAAHKPTVVAPTDLGFTSNDWATLPAARRLRRATLVHLLTQPALSDLQFVTFQAPGGNQFCRLAYHQTHLPYEVPVTADAASVLSNAEFSLCPETDIPYTDLAEGYYVAQIAVIDGTNTTTTGAFVQPFKVDTTAPVVTGMAGVAGPSDGSDWQDYLVLETGA
eukprot:scaffold408_cov388-Prasinococcus_capsulatus_cf.AAC.4